VAITGLGLVSPLGNDPESFFQALLEGRSGIARYAPADSPQPLAIAAARCVDFDPEAVLGRGLTHSMDRYSQLGVAAAFAAWRDAGLEVEPGEKLNAGVSWGTAVGGVLSYEHGYRELFLNGRQRVSPLSVVLGMNNAAASHIAIELGLAGPCLCYSVACASSAIAIGEAFRRVRDGEMELMLAGGSDAPLAFGVVRAWEALRVLAPPTGDDTYRACRPFSGERTGLVLGEGGGALLLEDWDHALRRGARIHAELIGYASNSDHMHLVRPAEQGQTRAIRAALDDAGMEPSEIGYVNAHGTATREGDPNEIAALRAVFGAGAESLPVSASKSMHGHLMGATGAIEMIASALALRHDALPPTAFLDPLDPACAGVRHITGTPLRGLGVDAALSNSFAFGGSNAVLVLRAVGAPVALPHRAVESQPPHPFNQPPGQGD
jgi:3-oxoacyl-[acyl-carrier-protein] synthase II